MFRYFIIVLFCGTVCESYVIQPGPKHKPTEGEIWPIPQRQQRNNFYYTYNHKKFKLESVGKTCAFLDKVLAMYTQHLSSLRSPGRRRGRRVRREIVHINSSFSKSHKPIPHKSAHPEDSRYRGMLQGLHVELTVRCLDYDYPHFGMVESYNLTVSSTIGKLRSASVWGIIRGLESFLQLLYPKFKSQEIWINSTKIVDYPRYAHRGLLVDTSRHYLSVKTLRTIIKGMAMNKMNVLHWHIVDDQSFPYQSERFPELSLKGAYSPTMVYTKENIAELVEYARLHAIRILPEFDVPGHTRSWGLAYPGILTECYEDQRFSGLGPLNPIKNITYKLIQNLFEEAQAWFPDTYFHVGGDEVSLDCWASNPEIKLYMNQHNLNPARLHAFFMEKTIPLLGISTPIVWQEVFDEGVRLPSNSLVQVWKSNAVNNMVQVLKSGLKVVFSSAWYLDLLEETFMRLYASDPRLMVYQATGNRTLISNIVGGEACMWGEMVDDTNILPRIWPRASAVAEKLWSSLVKPADMDFMLRRIEEHSCRMNRRRVPAEPPSGPGFCIVQP